MKIKYLLIISMMVLSGCGGTDNGVSEGSTPEIMPGQTYSWRMVTTWPKNLPGMGVAPETIANMVRKMSNGRLDIKVMALVKSCLPSRFLRRYPGARCRWV